MQTVSNSDLALLSAYSPVHLHMYLAGQEISETIGAFSMTASVGNQEILCGNAIASVITMTINASDLPDIETVSNNSVTQDADGYIVIPTTGDGANYYFSGYIVLPAAETKTEISITWDVNGSTEYPLFHGRIDNVTVSGGKATITAQDELYWFGSNPFSAISSYKTTCNAGTALSAIASEMRVSLNSDTAALAANVSITGGFSSCYSDISLSEAAGYVAGILGGNAVINRSGELAVVLFTSTNFSTEPYSGNATAIGSNYTPSGISFQRTFRVDAENDDDTVSQTEETETYIAGDGSIILNNPLADAASATRAYTALSAISSRKGTFSYPMGIHIEPGDVITVRSGDGNYPVAVITHQLEIDGGVKSVDTSGGKSDSGGTSGPITRQLAQLAAEFAQFKNLVAENATITSANIESIHAGNINVDSLFAQDITATGEFNVNNGSYYLTETTNGMRMGPVGEDNLFLTYLYVEKTGINMYSRQHISIRSWGALELGSDASHIETDSSIIPDTTGTQDLGSSSNRWANIYLTNSPNVSSDRHLKDQIKPISLPDFLYKLKPVRYKLIGSCADGMTHFGFIAQDVEDALKQSDESPESLGIISFTDDSDGRHGYSLAYEEFIPVLVETVQAQQSQIAVLERRIEALERMIQDG